MSVDPRFERAVLAEFALAGRRETGPASISELKARPRLLSRADEIRLAGRIEQGDPRARESMIESNLRLVHAVATRYGGSGVSFADLVQDGTVGLVRGVQSFDHRRGLRFSTYAVCWIRRSIDDAITESGAIRIPAKANAQLAAVRRAEAEAELECVTAPLGELMPDNPAADPLMSAIAAESWQQVLAMLRLLPECHRQVLKRRFGLGDGRAQSHEEIGGWLGVGEERSRQIEREALHRLRSIADTWALTI
jgi:RNA polymerase primary sigma factor